MTREEFFAKFELFAELPDAVARMREVILELATSGRIVRQDPADEPARDLIGRLKQSAQVTERASDRPQAETTEDVLGELPAGWSCARLGEIGSTNIGLTYRPQDIADSGTPVLRSNNIQDSEIDLGNLIRVAVQPKQSAMLYVGDLLICARNGSRALVGKTALIRRLSEPTAFGAFMAVFRSELNDYLFYFIRSPLFRRVISEVNTTTINKITQSNLRSKLVPIPPLAEQKRIVAKVDELMALCDQLEAQQKARETRHAALARASLSRFAKAPTPANLTYLFRVSVPIPPAEVRDAIRTLAVSGSLSDEATRRQHWTAATLGEVCSQITDGEHATPPRTPTGIPLATAKNVRDGFLDLRTTDWVSADTAAKSWKRCKPSHDDVLMVCVGATTGRVCRVVNPPLMVLVRSVALLRADPNYVVPSFLELFLRSPAGQCQVWSSVKQSAQPCLYLGRMNDFRISFPALEEQRRIVAKVDQLMALVDELEAQLAVSRDTAAKLLDAVVGELATTAAR